MSNWQLILLEPAKTFASAITRFLVNLLVAILILIIGWAVSKLIRTVITKIARIIRLDELSERIGLDDLLAKGGIKYSFSELLGIVSYWIVLLIAFVVAINAMGLTIAADLLNKIVLYIPNVISAIFILVLGMFVATTLKNIVQAAADNAGLVYANLLSRAVELMVNIFAITIALEQLNIAAEIIKFIIGIVLGSLGLGFAIAMGLGCKDIVGKNLSELIEKLKAKK